MLNTIDLEELARVIKARNEKMEELTSIIKKISGELESKKVEEKDLLSEKERVNRLLSLKSGGKLIRKNKDLIIDTKKSVESFWKGLKSTEEFSNKFSVLIGKDFGKEPVVSLNATLLPRKGEFYLSDIPGDKERATLSAGMFENGVFETICSQKGEARQCIINDGKVSDGELACFFPQSLGKAIFPQCSDEKMLISIKSFYDKGNEVLGKFKEESTSAFKETLASIEKETEMNVLELSKKVKETQDDLSTIDTRILEIKQELESTKGKLKE